LARANGKTLTFHTGVAVVHAGSLQVRTAASPVVTHFANLPEALRKRYLELEQPYDCASSMNGQNFAFHSYLPTDVALRATKLKELDALSAKTGATQLFIETPYRNAAMLEACLKALAASTRLGVACDLTLPTEWICVQTVAQWKQQPRPDFQKRPAVFFMSYSSK
jgi:hypothetical protein